MSPQTLFNLSLAALLGSMIGFERQWNQGMAGLRTNALVAFGSACFVSVGMHMGDDRVAAQIVSGIGFLGAGVILHEGPTVRGLNTATTLWCAAATGSLCGSGLHIEALYTALGVVVLNLGLRRIQAMINRRVPHPVDTEAAYSIEIICDAGEAAAIREFLARGIADGGLELRAFHREQVDAGGEPGGATRIALDLASHTRLDRAVGDLLGQIERRPGVTSARWSLTTPGATPPRGSAIMAGRSV